MLITTSRIAGDRIYRAEQVNKTTGKKEIAHSKVSHAHAIGSLIHRTVCQRLGSTHTMTLHHNGSRSCNQCNVIIYN